MFNFEKNKSFFVKKIIKKKNELFFKVLVLFCSKLDSKNKKWLEKKTKIKNKAYTIILLVFKKVWLQKPMLTSL